MHSKLIYGTIVLAFVINAITAIEHTKVINLNEDNWRTVLENEWMIEL